ncbi:MAG: dephospho-CoA kinase [Burkholderiales bacterium]
MDGLVLNRLRLGLTGGIGSGKSTVASLLVGMGARLVDTDAISRELTGAGGEALHAIASEFGGHLVSPTTGLDRAALRTLVFNDPDARQRLEGLLHPLILMKAEQQAAAPGAHSCVVFDVPLLVESQHWRARVNRVLLIDCAEAVQRRRVLQRPGWTEPQLDGVMAAQSSRGQRRQAADAIIDNSEAPLSELASALQFMMAGWLRAHAAMKESCP